MGQMEPHFRVVSRMFLTTKNWQAGHFLSHKEAPNLKCLAPILKSPSSLFFIFQRPTHLSQSCYFPSCTSKSGLFPTGHTNCLRGTYFQKRGLRSGPWGFVPSSNRILRKNKEEIQEALDSNWGKIEKLARLMGCQESSVARMVSKDTRIITSFSPAKVEAIIQLLLNYGFSADSIIRYQSVFCWNISTLQRRIEGLVPYRKYKFSIAHVIYRERIYHMIVAILAKEVKLMGSHPSRVSYLAELLNCKKEEVHRAIASGHRQLEYYKLSRLKSVVDVLVKHGFSTEDIMANLHLLQLDPLICKYRLKQMTHSGFFGKDKMLQTLTQTNNHYPVMFNFHLSNAQALGEHDDKFAFLQSRLQCSRQQIDLLLMRAPTIRHITPRRIKEILNILLDEFEFPPRTILRNHHLLFFSAKRLRNRWEVLSDFPLHEGQLVADLIMPEVKFEKKYEKWFKINKADVK